MIYVERISQSGFPLLMLHGWGHSHESLKPLGELLATTSQVHLIDLPGFGRSALPQDTWDSTWDSSNYADQLLEYLDQQGLDSVDIIGHSFGGKVALRLASKSPTRVRKLILMGSSGLKRKRSFKDHCRMQALKWAASLLKRFDKAFGTTLFKTKFAPRFGSKDYLQAGKLKDILVKTVNEDLTASLKRITCPTLILWGENDQETPPEIAERFASLIAHSKAYIFPGKDHHLFADGGAHLSASYIKPFLEAPNG